MKYSIDNDRIIFTQLGDEGVLLDTLENNYLSLNETLFFILKAVQDKKSTEEMIEELCEQYDVSVSECKNEVEEALTLLVNKNIIKLN